MTECAVGNLKARYRSLISSSCSVTNTAILIPDVYFFHSVYETMSIISAFVFSDQGQAIIKVAFHKQT